MAIQFVNTEYQTYHNLCNEWSVLHITHLFLCYHGNWIFSAFGLAIFFCSHACADVFPRCWKNPQGTESIFPACACAVRVRPTCACVFATKTMAVRIFRSGKISNFGGIFFPIVHLFRLGSNGF